METEDATWDVPCDVLIVIWSFLRGRDLARCESVCRRWCSLLCRRPEPWHAVAEREGLVLATGNARDCVVAALTSELWAWGNLSGPGHAWSGHGSGCDRTTSPRALGRVLHARSDADLCEPRPVPVHSVAAGADFVLLLTWAGRVFDSRAGAVSSALGWGFSYVMPTTGAGQVDPIAEGQPLGWAPVGDYVRAVAAGADGGVLAVTGSGAVYAWGDNGDGQLGRGVDNGRGAEAAWWSEPSCVFLRDGFHVSGCACGPHASCFWSADGLWVSGAGIESGAGHVDVQPLVGAPVAHASLSRDALAVVTADGRLLVADLESWASTGAPTAFVLLGPDVTWKGMPRLHQRPGGGGGEAHDRVSGVCLSDTAKYCTTEGGSLYVWGSGSQGELGLGKGCLGHLSVPCRVSWCRDVVALATGPHLVVAVDRQGRVHSAGRNVSGQRGLGSTARQAQGKAVRFPAHVAVRSVACLADSCVAVSSWVEGSGGGAKAAPRLTAAKDVRGSVERDACVSEPRNSDEGLFSATSLARHVGDGEEWLEPAWQPSDREREVEDALQWDPLSPGGGSSPACRDVRRERGRARKEGFEAHIARRLSAFAAADGQSTLALSPRLTGWQRHLAHVACESLGLQHQSFGEGRSRRLVVWKNGEESDHQTL